MDKMNGHGPAGQKGVVLIMTLVILVIITMSSMAMMLSMRAGISASGNIAFRQAAVKVADVALEDAFVWIGNNADDATLETDHLGGGLAYYAVENRADSDCTRGGVTTFMPQTYDFAKAGCATKRAASVAGYELYYVVHRMAAGNGACGDAGVLCLAPISASTTTTGTGDSQDAEGAQFSGSAGSKTVYYRITVKVSGPRRNNRFVQSFVY